MLHISIKAHKKKKKLALQAWPASGTNISWIWLCSNEPNGLYCFFAFDRLFTHTIGSPYMPLFSLAHNFDCCKLICCLLRPLDVDVYISINWVVVNGRRTANYVVRIGKSNIRKECGKWHFFPPHWTITIMFKEKNTIEARRCVLDLVEELRMLNNAFVFSKMYKAISVFRAWRNNTSSSSSLN